MRSLRQQSTNRIARRGFTLMEMLLVMAILVIVAAAAMPALTGTLRDQQLRHAADMVRVEWSRAHVQAMKSGRIQMFRYEMGAKAFAVAPWAAGDEMLEGATPSTQTLSGMAPADVSATTSLAGNSTTGGEGAAPGQKQLPEEISFAGGDAQGGTRAAQIEQSILESERKIEWSRPVLFYPDGTASDAFVTVANEQGKAIRVELRGLTGTATVSEITAVEDLSTEVEL